MSASGRHRPKHRSVLPTGCKRQPPITKFGSTSTAAPAESSDLKHMGQILTSPRLLRMIDYDFTIDFLNHEDGLGAARLCEILASGRVIIVIAWQRDPSGFRLVNS